MNRHVDRDKALRQLQHDFIVALAPTLRWLDSQPWFTVKAWMMDIANKH